MQSIYRHKKPLNLKAFTLSVLLLNGFTLDPAIGSSSPPHDPLLARTKEMMGDVNKILNQYYSDLEITQNEHHRENPASSAPVQPGHDHAAPGPITAAGIKPDPKIDPAHTQAVPPQDHPASPQDHPSEVKPEAKVEPAGAQMSYEEHSQMYDDLMERKDVIAAKLKEVQELTTKLNANRNDKNLRAEHKAARTEYMKLLEAYRADVNRHTEAGAKLKAGRGG